MKDYYGAWPWFLHEKHRKSDLRHGTLDIVYKYREVQLGVYESLVLFFFAIFEIINFLEGSDPCKFFE